MDNQSIETKEAFIANISGIPTKHSLGRTMWNYNDLWHYTPPNYFNDLNLIQKAEQFLNWDERKIYHKKVCALSRARPDFKQRPDIMETVWFGLSEITAEQRASLLFETILDERFRNKSIPLYLEKSIHE